MRLFICLLLLASTVVVLQGCATLPNSPVFAPLVLSEKGPVAGFDTTAKATRVGRARSEGIILVGYGDSSINAAKLAGGINKIHHVDSSTMNIFGIYSRYETVVYGE